MALEQARPGGAGSDSQREDDIDRALADYWPIMERQICQVVEEVLPEILPRKIWEELERPPNGEAK
jgi:hypothetical protein